MVILLPLFHLLNRWYPQLPARLFLVAYGLTLGVGVASIDTLSISMYQKTIVLIMYIPFAIFALFVFAITFGCFAFGDCL